MSEILVDGNGHPYWEKFDRCINCGNPTRNNSPLCSECLREFYGRIDSTDVAS